MEHKGSSPRSQELDPSLYSDPLQPSPCLRIPVLENPIVLLSPRLHLSLPSGLIPSDLRTEIMNAPLRFPITYLLTPVCRVLLEKLTGLQLVKKFPAFYGTQRLITALTSVRHLSLSWANPIQSTYQHPTSWRS